MMEFFLSLTFWKTVLASTTPVMLATLAANMMTKAGNLQSAIEGTRLICALTGVVVSAFTQNLWIGCIAAVAMGILVSFIFGYFSLIMKGAMNACGVAHEPDRYRRNRICSGNADGQQGQLKRAQESYVPGCGYSCY